MSLHFGNNCITNRKPGCISLFIHILILFGLQGGKKRKAGHTRNNQSLAVAIVTLKQGWTGRGAVVKEITEMFLFSGNQSSTQPSVFMVPDG